MSNRAFRTIVSREVTFTHGRLRTITKPDARRQRERSHRALREVPEDTSRSRLTAVAGRTGSTHLRKRLCTGMEALGRPPENDPERIPSHAVAEGSAGTDRKAHGRFLLRSQCRAATRLRATTDQITPNRWIRYPARRAGNFPLLHLRLRDVHFAVDAELEAVMSASKRLFDRPGCIARGEDESQIAPALW